MHIEFETIRRSSLSGKEMILPDPRTVHRFIPATMKHGNKTACGIGLSTGLLKAGGTDAIEAVAVDGAFLRVAEKGQSFDCRRCKAVIEQFKKGRITA